MIHCQVKFISIALYKIQIHVNKDTNNSIKLPLFNQLLLMILESSFRSIHFSVDYIQF